MQICCAVYVFGIPIHHAVFTITERQTKYTVRHILIPSKNLVHVSAYRKHHLAPLLLSFKDVSPLAIYIMDLELCNKVHDGGSEKPGCFVFKCCVWRCKGKGKGTVRPCTGTEVR